MPEKAKVFKADICVAGGGIAGLTLAIILARQGLAVHVIEPKPPAKPEATPVSSRTVALMENSLNVLRAAGMDHVIDGHGTTLEAMRIIDDSLPGRDDMNLVFSAAEIGKPRFGMNIPNDMLRACLYGAAGENKNITMHSGSAVRALDVHPFLAHVTLDNDSVIQAPLVVGADGRDSRVRALAGIDCKIKHYDQSAITCLIAHTRPHNNTATEFHRPSGPLAFVPMKGNISSVVWLEPSKKADEIMRLSRDDFTDALQRRSNGILGTIALESNPQSWPLRTQRAESLTAPRVALMAEAAHVMSPVTAQGLNLSLRDVGVLAETIVDAARAGIDPGSQTVLDQYQRRRLSDVQSRMFGVDGMNTIISTDFGFVKTLRRGGLKAVAGIKPLKQFATHHGLAPDIDIGRVANGRAL